MNPKENLKKIVDYLISIGFSSNKIATTLWISPWTLTSKNDLRDTTMNKVYARYSELLNKIMQVPKISF